jgi:hypothetical protein
MGDSKHVDINDGDTFIPIGAPNLVRGGPIDSGAIVVHGLAGSGIRFALPVDSLGSHDDALLQGNQRVIGRLSFRGDLVELFSVIGTERLPGNRVEGKGLFACQWLEFDGLRFAAPTPDEPALKWQVQVDGEGLTRHRLTGRYHTTYLGELVPVTRWQSQALTCTITLLAPQDENTRPRGAIYRLDIENRTGKPLTGRVSLQAAGTFRESEAPMWVPDKGQLSYTGASLWNQVPAFATLQVLENNVEAAIDHEHAVLRWPYNLAGGATQTFAVLVAIGESPTENDQTLTELAARDFSSWLSETVQHVVEPIGKLELERGSWWKAFLLNHIIRGANAIRTDGTGNVLGVAIGPDMLWQTVNREDAFRCLWVHPWFAPDLFRAFVLYACRYLTPPPAIPFEENTAPNVHLAILAELYYRATGDTAFFSQHPEIHDTIEALMSKLFELRDPNYWLFPAEEVSDGHTLKTYDFCTHIQIWRALRAAARLMREILSQPGLADHYDEAATQVRSDVLATMTTEGVFGPQFAAATDLENTICYIDGEDNIGTLAPYLGFCDATDPRWHNYCRQGLSVHNPIYDQETGGLCWVDDPNIGHTIGRPTAPSFASRMAAATRLTEARQEMRRIQRLSDIETTFYWYPSFERPRGGLGTSMWMTGSASWLLLTHYLGIDLDTPKRHIVFKPWSPWHRFSWNKVRLGWNRFSFYHVRGDAAHTSTLTNLNDTSWNATFGFYIPEGQRCKAFLLDGDRYGGDVHKRGFPDAQLQMLSVPIPPHTSVTVTAILHWGYSSPDAYA